MQDKKKPQSTTLTPAATKDPRQQIVELIELIYWLIIFEGSLRKWFLAPLSKPLFFVRDPFTLYVCYLAWKYDLIPHRSRMLRAAAVIAVIFSALAVVQCIRDDNNFATAIYGLRMYFLNLPLAFVAGAILTGSDLKRIAKRTLLLGIPMAALVFVQYRSAPDSPVNKTLDGGEAFVYTNVARASGTFSFTQGHELFTHTLLCFLVSSWLLPPKHRPLNGPWLLLATIAAVLNVILDGNRGVFVCLFITLAFSLFYRIFLRRQRISLRTFAPEWLCLVGAIIYVCLFSTAFDAMKTRMESNSDEGVGRVFDIMFRSIARGIQDSHLLGNGIGGGSNGGKALLSPVARLSRVAQIDEESELGRVVSEAGPAGLLFIIFRFALAGQLIVQASLASKRSQNPLPIILASFPALCLSVGQITFNGTSNGYAWIFVGFSLAANELASRNPAMLLLEPTTKRSPDMPSRGGT